jgi:hypothetical protein
LLPGHLSSRWTTLFSIRDEEKRKWTETTGTQKSNWQRLGVRPESFKTCPEGFQAISDSKSAKKP